MLFLLLSIWSACLEAAHGTIDCMPQIALLPMREKGVEVSVSEPFVSFSYVRPCYAADAPVLQVFDCAATIYVSAVDPADDGVSNLESFEALPEVPAILRVSDNLLRDGPLYIWADSNGRVSVPQRIEMCRRAVLAVPTVSLWTEKNWVKNNPSNVINFDLLSERNRLLAAGIVSPAQTRLLYQPVPLLASLSANTQLSDSVTVRVLYVIVDGEIPNVFDVCELPGNVEHVSDTAGQPMKVSRFLCARFRSGIWRVYNASSVPSVLPPSTLYMAATEQDKLLPSLVSYTVYSLDKSLEDRVEQTLQRSVVVPDMPNTVTFILELIGLCLLCLVAIWLLERTCSVHGTLHPGKPYLSRRWKGFPLLDVSKPLNLWLLRYNPRLNLASLSKTTAWRPYVRIIPKFWCCPERKILELAQTILLSRNEKAHQKHLLIECLLRGKDQSCLKSIYHSPILISGPTPHELLRNSITVHTAPSQCNKGHGECTSPIRWISLTATEVACFCSKHAPESPQRIAIPKKLRRRCMFCLLAYGDRVCLHCAGGSLLCGLCEEFIHSNCKVEHRVIKAPQDGTEEISSLMSECLGSQSVI